MARKQTFLTAEWSEQWKASYVQLSADRQVACDKAAIGRDDPAKRRSRELALTPGDPNALASDRDHRSIQEVSLMLGEDGLHQRDPLPDRDIGQPDHSGMSFARGKDQLSEVLVHGDEDPPFRRGPGQEGPVSRIGASLLGFKDVMALLAQPFRQAPAGAAVNQEIHLAMT